MAYGKNNFSGSPANFPGVPDVIICNRCDVPKGKAFFSTRFLGELKQHISDLQRKGKRFDAKHDKHVPCSTCTNGNVVELECDWCEETKAVTEFSNEQRRSKGDRKCRDCQQEINTVEPRGRESDHEEDSPGSRDDDDDDSDGGATTTAKTMSEMSISGASKPYTSGPSSGTGGVRVPNTSNGGSSSAGTARPSLAEHRAFSMDSPGADAAKAPQMRNHPPSSVAGSTASTSKSKSTWAQPAKGPVRRVMKQKASEDEFLRTKVAESDPESD